MAKISKNVAFKNAEFRVTKDELTGEKRIFILEMDKDEDIYTDLDEILEMFKNESGLSISIKIDKRFGE